MKYSLSKDQLIFKNDYCWNETQKDDPRISGPITDTPFNPSEGFEVLYLVNALISTWKFDDKRYAIKLEKMIRCGVTGKSISQKEVKKWIKSHWLDY